MISPKKLIKLARRWPELASSKRKRISFPRLFGQKGHFVLYSLDKKLFVNPLSRLESEFIRELLEMAEEHFGLKIDGPITLPCDSLFLEYAISSIRKNTLKDVEKALLMSVSSGRCLPFSSLHGEPNNQSLVFSF